MNNMLIISQDEKFTGMVKFLGIGQRNPKTIIGDELKSLLEEKKMTSDELINLVGNSYRDNIKRVLENQEQPKPKLVELITTKLGVGKDYFEDKELENVIVTDNNIVVAKYPTNKRTLEVKKELDIYITECVKKGINMVIEMPKE
nr:MAG TPA: HTH-type transcriptional regulator [Caudoviricetes sp.]